MVGIKKSNWQKDY